MTTLKKYWELIDELKLKIEHISFLNTQFNRSNVSILFVVHNNTKYKYFGFGSTQVLAQINAINIANDHLFHSEVVTTLTETNIDVKSLKTPDYISLLTGTIYKNGNHNFVCKLTYKSDDFIYNYYHYGDSPNKSIENCFNNLNLEH